MTRASHLALAIQATRTHGCNSPKIHFFINRKYLHQNHPNTLITKALYPEESHGGKLLVAHYGIDTKTKGKQQ
uniref:Uncharacterized protein n=1 Tax=Vitis vinifera TaxID=29760 RepID=F6HR95_VITVI